MAVRDGVAESHDQRCAGGGQDVDALQPVVHLRGGRIRHGRLSGDVPFLDVGGMQADAMERRRAGFSREVQADRQIADRCDGQIHRVAQNHHPGSNRAARFAVEGKRPVRSRNDLGTLGANGDMRRAHGQRLASESIGEVDAQSAASNAGVHDHAHGLMAEALRAYRLLLGRGWRGRGWRSRCASQQLRRGPGGHPMLPTFRLSLDAGEMAELHQNQQGCQS